MVDVGSLTACVVVKDRSPYDGSMNPNTRLPALLALIIFVGVQSVASRACHASEEHDGLFLAFWNVENLFDTVDDPQTEKDEEFTPSAEKKWTQSRLDIKLNNLRRVISDMNNGRGPDVLGLCEVENRDVVELLVKHLGRLDRRYAIVHQDSPSFRGIDCALIYDRSVCELKQSRFHRIDGMTTRDIVEAELAVGGQPLTVFVNHWPSRYNPAEARIKVAGVLRGRVDELLRKDPSSDIVILGDLNDTPADPSVEQTLRASVTPSEEPGSLLNLMGDLHGNANAGSYVYRNKWNVLDHVIVSGSLLDDGPLSLDRSSVAAVMRDYQVYTPRNPESIPRPSRSFSGPIFHRTGYSDHLPVVCRIRVAAP